MSRILVVALAVLTFLVRRPLFHTVRAVLLVTQSFLRLPFRPLTWLTPTPRHHRIVLDSAPGPIVGDLYLPGSRPPSYSRPALILAAGVRMLPADRPHLLRLAEALARLGYVVLWPRSLPLEDAQPEIEAPETFVAAFQYLLQQRFVAPDRISLIGFSAGASVAFVAAAHPAIAEHVHALVFFAGYFDVFAYVRSLATRTSIFEGERIDWQPSDWAIHHVRSVLQSNHAAHLATLLEHATPVEIDLALQRLSAAERETLERLSPAHHLDGFRARIYILHDRADPFVPYLESRKLERALPARVPRTLLITDAFEHTVPRGGRSWTTAWELARFLGMLRRILAFI